MKNKSFQRYSNWKAAFTGDVYTRNGEVHKISGVAKITLNLQYPVTSIGWNQAQGILRAERPTIMDLLLLALTPYEPDNGEDH